MSLRMTNQREMILRELQRSKQHLTADELFARVKKIMPRISLATVYRNLETLSEAKMIAKLEVSGRQKRFDYDMREHDHIYCVVCHRVDNLAIDRESIRGTGWNSSNGYAVQGFRLEVAGICPDCQQATSANETNQQSWTKVPQPQ
ncbi:MAG: Fur family transcriptional regulator [Desulfopila sp.]